MSSISETAERICRHNLDSERVSVTQFCDIQAAIEKALRDERERAAKIADLWGESHTCDNHDTDPCCHVRTGGRIAEKIRAGDAAQGANAIEDAIRKERERCVRILNKARHEPGAVDLREMIARVRDSNEEVEP